MKIKLAGYERRFEGNCGDGFAVARDETETWLISDFMEIQKVWGWILRSVTRQQKLHTTTQRRPPPHPSVADHVRSERNVGGGVLSGEQNRKEIIILIPRRIPDAFRL